MPSRNIPRWIEIWNRKFHIYIGLYLLLFVWLFSISGLFLNHPKWQFAQFWPQRKQSSFERSIQPPAETESVAKAKHLMQQLDIKGEIQQITTHPEKAQFDFRVFRPGHIIDIKADLDTKRAKISQIQVNGWGVFRALHQFSGVRMNDPKEKRDWLWTRIWSLSMDAVALGIIIMVLSGIYMWYKILAKRRLGLIALGLGVLCCGFFVFALGRLH
ncbi:PepSY-associated TM helix domain-containing protein [Candidatus Poribacteria bacterium]|nr:PepSY-associated TM helix domain-containing protein [Candidatus Poribacteria bacterium]